MRHLRYAIYSIILAFAAVVYAQGTTPAPSSDEEPVGEFAAFNVKVPRGNYLFVKSAILLFGSRWGVQPANDAEMIDKIWEDLLLSFEAYRRGITVEDKEINDEIAKTLQNEKVDFDWQKDPAAYAAWLKKKTGEPPELFANQIRHLMQLDKLRRQIMASIKPTVTEAEALQEFRNEYNTLSVELAQFDKADDAAAFYAKVKKNAKLWDQELKSNPTLFRKPGFVSLEFLREMWKLPEPDLYRMMKLSLGSIYQPIPIYGGKTGVCRIMEKRPAKDADFPGVKASYFQQLETRKKYDGMNTWIKQFKQEAQIKAYKNVGIVPQTNPKKEKGP
jgi:hypothetical protein